MTETDTFAILKVKKQYMCPCCETMQQLQNSRHLSTTKHRISMDLYLISNPDFNENDFLLDLKKQSRVISQLNRDALNHLIEPSSNQTNTDAINSYIFQQNKLHTTTDQQTDTPIIPPLMKQTNTQTDPPIIPPLIKQTNTQTDTPIIPPLIKQTDPPPIDNITIPKEQIFYDPITRVKIMRKNYTLKNIRQRHSKVNKSLHNRKKNIFYSKISI